MENLTKTTEASLTSKITLPDSTLAGATTPYNLLYQPAAGRKTRTLFIQLLPDTNRKGLQPLQAYYVGPSTTLPPCKDKIEKKRERPNTDSVQALLTLSRRQSQSELVTLTNKPLTNSG